MSLFRNRRWVPSFLRSNAARRTRRSRAAADVPQDLELEGSIELIAADGDGDAPPKLKLVANTGAAMDLEGFAFPVVIDMTGAKFAKAKTPILADHDRRLRVGFTTAQTVEAGRITAEGLASSSTNVAKGIVADMRGGFPFEVSVGAKILKAEFTPEGERVEVNGRRHKGPVIVARSVRIREISILTLGGDEKTSAKIAATERQRQAMNEFEKWLQAMGLVLEELSDEQRDNLQAEFDEVQQLRAAGRQPKKKKKAAAEEDDEEDDDPIARRRKLEAAETQRVDALHAAFGRYPDVASVTLEGEEKETPVGDLKATAIRDGWTDKDVEILLLRAERPNPSKFKGVHVVPDIEGDLYAEAIQVAVARDRFEMPANVEAHGKKYGYENQWSEKVLEASDDRRLRNPSLHYLMDLVIQAAEGTMYSGDRKSDDFIRAYFQAHRQIKAAGSGPFSTLTVTNILENVANKFLLTRFAMQPTAWQDVAEKQNLNDFKPASLYRLDENLGYLKLGPEGELKHGQLTDTKRTVQADTWGRITGLSRQKIRNDDLMAFRQILIGLSEGSAWAKESELFELLLANTGNFFSAGNNNLIDDDFGIDGITQAEIMFRNHVSAAGKPISAMPNRVLVGTQDGVLAGQVRSDTRLIGDTDRFQNNPHVGKYEPVVTPYLNNTSIRKPDGSQIANQDSDLWFLLADPNLIGVVVIGHLDGRMAPFIESDESSFDTLGMQWRGYDDWGVAQGDTQAGVMSSGDGGS